MEATAVKIEKVDLELDNYFDKVVKELINKLGDKHDNEIYYSSEKISSGYRIYLKSKAFTRVKSVNIILSNSKIITVKYHFYSTRLKQIFSIDEIVPEHFNPYLPQSNKDGLNFDSFSRVILEIIDYITSDLVPIKNQFKGLYL